MRDDEILGLLPRLTLGVDQNPGLRVFALELFFWAIVVLLTIALLRFRPAILETVESRIRDVSQYKRFWLATFVFGVMLVRLALLPWMPVPIPILHDEFSYLLGSDTFAHGRLTNPPSPMWEHFESFHINVLPTYQSMYPPAQSLTLAIGQTLTHVPWAGVLLTSGLMCGAIYWMLLGWLPAPWAWLGGMFAWVRFGIFSYWINSYLGGTVAAIGGALLLGALPRFRNRPKAQTALIFSAGLLILANSRPLEGLLFSVPLVIALAVALVQNITGGKIAWAAAARMISPALAVLLLGGAWMLYYNWRGTGNPLVMPYAVNFQTYHIAKPFFFQKLNPLPVYHHASMKEMYVMHEMTEYQRSKYAMASIVGTAAGDYYLFFIWPFALLIGPSLYAMWRSEMRVVLLAVVLLAADLFSQIWTPQPHYAAPAAGAFLLFLIFSVRHFRSSGSPSAIWGSRALAIVFAVCMISPIADKLRDPFMMRPYRSAILSGSDALLPLSNLMPAQIQRASIQSELEERGGKHLIIVHYPKYAVPWEEWVYNGADLENAPVIWARDMGYFDNQELVKYYADRQVWYADRGNLIQTIVPYDAMTAPLKLAYERAASQNDSPRFEGATQNAAAVGLSPAARRRAVAPAAISR